MIKIVPDAGAISSGELRALIESSELDGAGIILPSAVIDELYTAIDSGDSRASHGLDEISHLHKIAPKAGITIRVYGEKIPRVNDVHTRAVLANMVRNIALDNSATLYTNDPTQALAAKAAGIPVRLCTTQNKDQALWFLKYFDETTMSVHLKEGVKPAAKRGKPGSVSLVTVDENILSKQDMESYFGILEDMVKSGNAADISKPGALVFQYETYRIAATHPPFSEAHEITIVHPTVNLKLEDYEMSEKLRERLVSGAEGILISGSPGSGKSTLASALANYYHQSLRTVKTLESPRDLQLDVGVTQYSRLDGKFANSADILLLVRPDYTIFDEVRRIEDFEVFADLRLSGVGMVGVVHASSPLDAVQRFIGKIELGIIPHVLDTVVFVQGGSIMSVYSLSMRVKVPSGMTEQDLARPVIEIKDFETGKLVYEVYAFGEENMIVPVTETANSSTGIDHLAQERICEIMRRFDNDPQVEILSPGRIRIGVSKGNIAAIIGRGGSNIGALERELRVHIDIVERGTSSTHTEKYDTSDSNNTSNSGIDFEISESSTFLMFEVDRQYSGSQADIYSGTDIVFSSRIDRKGRMRIPRHASSAKIITRAYTQGKISIIIANP